MRGPSPIGTIKPYTTFTYYKENVDPKVKVGILMYEKIISNYCKFLAGKLIDIGIVKLPAGTGVLQVFGRNIRCFIDKKNGKIRGVIDWYETKKLWEECEECKKNKQLVFFTNEHSGYKVYRVFWLNKTNKIINKLNYSFHTRPAVRKEISKRIKSGDYCYMDLARKKRRKK